MRQASPIPLALLLAACSAPAPQACPVAASVVPPALGGDAYLRGLTDRLAGTDRENAITEAVSDMEQRAPTLTSEERIDILIAADCPNAAASPYRTEVSERARIAAFRSEVNQIVDTDDGVSSPWVY